MSDKEITSEELAKRIRIKVLRMINKAKASHIAGAFSSAEIIAVLYNDIMVFDKDDVMPSRDRLILSKGHNGAALYAVLSELEFISNEEINNYYLDGSNLSGHISHKNVNGVEFSTGSLGHGVCVACGMAKAAKIDGKKHRVFSIMGDGECNEGSVWETALFAYHHKLDNFTIIVDHNKLQGITKCSETLDLIDLGKKWEAFGWKVIEVDGHNCLELKEAFEVGTDKPKCIIAHTIKGKGVSFMENNNLWHYRDPQGELYEKALKELENLDA